jgi:hypothetical protein
MSTLFSCVSPIPNLEEVEKFKELYLQRFGVALSDQEALMLSLKFLTMMYYGHNPTSNTRK